ncbi:MAG: NAD-dependent epimerase/dehydratase family protein [bacterium]|nr:NAD-dependent epimerase/dehydratase family protein [bacterium]
METIFEKKNVIVIGGAGFKGSHLCERLLKEAKVICVDDLSESSPQNINHLLQYPDFEFIKHDITQPIDLEQFDELGKFKIKFQGIQEIYNFACPSSPQRFDEQKMRILYANSAGVINSLNLAVKYNAKFVLGSSSVVYGDATDEKEIFQETDLGTVDQLSLRACYDEGKRFAEAAVETYRQVYKIDAKIARVFKTFGPRMRIFEGHLIPDFILNALDGKDLIIYGDQKFSSAFCYVSDMIDGLVRLMAADPEVKLVNLGGDKVWLLSEIADMVIKMTGSKSKLVYDQPLVFLNRKGAPDLAYAKDALGWFPLVSLEDGLAKTIEYVVANKEAIMFGKKTKL